MLNDALTKKQAAAAGGTQNSLLGGALLLSFPRHSETVCLRMVAAKENIHVVMPSLSRYNNYN